MDTRRVGRIITVSGISLYTVDIIISIILYTILVTVPFFSVQSFANSYILKATVTAVPIISGVFDTLILAMIIMSLKYAEYYGITKSALAIITYSIIYSSFLFIFISKAVIDDLLITLMAFGVLQIVVLYYYARIQKEMFG